MYIETPFDYYRVLLFLLIGRTCLLTYLFAGSSKLLLFETFIEFEALSSFEDWVWRA
jgi:hypothetical protein